MEIKTKPTENSTENGARGQNKGKEMNVVHFFRVRGTINNTRIDEEMLKWYIFCASALGILSIKMGKYRQDFRINLWKALLFIKDKVHSRINGDTKLILERTNERTTKIKMLFVETKE